MSQFSKRKEHIVASLVEHVDPNRRDKSPKGFIDEPILDLMHLINVHPDYYTTSSCSGRVAIYCEGKIEEKRSKGGRWLYCSHEPAMIPDNQQEEWVMNLLFQGEEVVYSKEINIQHQLIYFKFEPLILHIEASTYDSAMHLLSVAHQIGYQNSGITASKRHMIAIRSTLKIDAPIGYIHNNRIHCVVSPDYLLLLIQLSNDKFQQNRNRLKLFENALSKEVEPFFKLNKE